MLILIVVILIVINIVVILIVMMIIEFIRSGRGLINMSEFESSRRLEEAIQLEPGVEYSVRVVTRWIGSWQLCETV